MSARQTHAPNNNSQPKVDKPNENHLSMNKDLLTPTQNHPVRYITAAQAPAYSLVLNRLKTKKLFQAPKIPQIDEKESTKDGHYHTLFQRNTIQTQQDGLNPQQTHKLKESLDKSQDNMSKSIWKQINEYESTQGFPSSQLQYALKIQEYQQQIKAKSEKLEQLAASNQKLEQLLEYYQDQTEIANNRQSKENKEKDQIIRKLHVHIKQLESHVQSLSKALRQQCLSLNKSENCVQSLKCKLKDQESTITHLEEKIINQSNLLQKYQSNQKQESRIMNQDNFQKMINFYQNKIEKIGIQFGKQRQVGQHQINGLLYKLQIQQNQINHLNANIQKLLISQNSNPQTNGIEMQLAQEYFHRFNIFASTIEKRLGQSIKQSERTTHSYSMQSMHQSKDILEEISILLKKNKELQILIKKSMVRNEQLRKRQMAL